MSILTEFYVDGKRFKVINYDWSFNQPIDATGRPVAAPQGGIMNILIETEKDEPFTEWAVNPTMMMNTKLIQRSVNLDVKSRIIDLVDVYCIEATDSYKSTGSKNLSTLLVLSPAQILVNGEKKMKKHWKVTDLNAKKVVPTSRNQEPEEEKNISVKASFQKGTFVPMGIKDFKGNPEQKNMIFNIEVKENTAEKMLIEVLKNGNILFNEEINEGDLLSLGEHQWKWDGFDNNENLSTYSLKNDPLSLKVTVWFEGKEKSDLLFIDKIEEKKYDWVDVDIQRNIKQMIVYLKVNLRDGGAEGLEKASKVPQEVTHNFGFPAITERTKSYEELETMALSGINKYWSRNREKVETFIDGENWEITVIAKSDKSGMVAPKIIYRTNKEAGRSRNWELSRELYYNTGYLYYSDWKAVNKNFQIYKNKGWYFLNDPKRFSETSAHEIGHEILLAYGGQDYSKRHKSTSTLFQEEIPNTPYPNKGEIDLMKYSSDESYPDDYYDKVVASSKDVISLIWLAKLKF